MIINWIYRTYIHSRTLWSNTTTSWSLCRKQICKIVSFCCSTIKRVISSKFVGHIFPSNLLFNFNFLNPYLLDLLCHREVQQRETSMSCFLRSLVVGAFSSNWVVLFRTAGYLVTSSWQILWCYAWQRLDPECHRLRTRWLPRGSLYLGHRRKCLFLRNWTVT
jgi:hypothetical protein